MATITDTSTALVRTAADIRDWFIHEIAQQTHSEPSTVDPDAPVETLGVDSLGAIGIAAGLAAWLGRDVPATLLWDHPTINALADALADQKRPQLPQGVVAFQPRGHLTPVFFLPGVGGHPVTFAAMAKCLGDNRPCYGLTVPGINGERRPCETVEEIAAALLETIRLVQPDGPYQLAGYSFGGMLAYEAARQLAAAVQTVSMLAIYDMIAPAGRSLRPMWQRLGIHAYLLATRPGRAEYLRTRLRKWWARHEPETNAVPEPELDPDPIANATHHVAKINTRAAIRYRPGPYDGNMLLFRATQRDKYSLFHRADETLGWSTLVRGTIRVIQLSGNHIDLMDGPNAPHAAKMLIPYLCRT